MRYTSCWRMTMHPNGYALYRADRAVAFNVEQESKTIAPQTTSIHAGVRGAVPSLECDRTRLTCNTLSLYPGYSVRLYAPFRLRA